MPTEAWVVVPIDQEVEGVGDDCPTPFYFPVGGAKFVFEFTQEEFTKVLSALINGAGLTYPDEWINVVWMFLRNVECPVSICSLIIECIENDEDVKAAIEGLVTSSPTINNYITNMVERLTPEQLTGPLIYGACTDSEVAGRVIALVAALDQNNIDALEIIEVGTNDEEKIATVIEGIPVVGELPFDQIIDFTQDLLEDFAENYNAASTTERKDALAEALWCLAKEQPDCELTYEVLFNFFQTRATTNLDTLATALDVVNFVRDGDFDNDQVLFDSMMAIQIAFVNAGREFFGINLPKIGALTQDAAPSSAWLGWDACGEGELCEGGEGSNFILGTAGWSIWLQRAVYGAGQGYTFNPAIAGNRISILRAMAPTPVRMKFNVTGNADQIRLYNSTGGGLGTISGSTSTYVTESDGSRTYTMATITHTTTDAIIDIGGPSALPAGIRLRWVCWNYDL